jgi:thiamine kinase-like enzyme
MALNDGPPPDVLALADRVPAWHGLPRELRALTGGITNHNWLVAVGGEHLVLRAPGQNSDLLGIDRGHEREAAERAAALGIGPAVVAFVEPEGALVSRFVPDAATLTPGDLQQPDLLITAVELLSHYHESPPIAGQFNWFDVPCQYATRARDRGVTVPPAFDLALARAREVQTAFAVNPDPLVPCHNDLLAANFLRGADDQLWLIDWEYAGMNDRYFDLGNLAVNNELDGDADEALIEAYFGDVTMGRLARLRLMKVMSDLREAMWGLVQVGTDALDVDYEEYATTHFERLVANASTPRWSRLLVEAAAGSGLRD